MPSSEQTITLYPLTKESPVYTQGKPKGKRSSSSIKASINEDAENLVIAKSDLARLLALLPTPSSSNFDSKNDQTDKESTNKSATSTPFNKLPPRFQLRRARAVFKDYDVHGTSKVESACLLPMLKELMGEDVMLKVGGGIRWWVLGVTSGDVVGFLDGSSGFEHGKFGEIEFERVAAAVSEAWSREERKEKGDRIRVVVKKKKMKKGRGRSRRRNWEDDDDVEDYEEDDDYDDDGSDFASSYVADEDVDEEFTPVVQDVNECDVEEYVDEEVRVREESPMHRLNREEKERKEKEERKAKAFKDRCTSTEELEARKQKGEAWTVKINEKDPDEEEEDMEQFIENIVNEDEPKKLKPLAAPKPALKSRGMSALDDVKLKTLRIMLEAADASGTYNGALSGTVNARVFQRCVENTLGVRVDVEGLLGKGGVCYRVFLRDPEAWGWKRAEEEMGRTVSSKDYGQTEVEGGLLRRVRQKIVRIAESWDRGGYGLGMMDIKRQFDVLDNGRGVEGRAFLRCLRRIGISLSKKGEKRLLRELERMGGYGNGLVAAHDVFFDFVTSKEDEDKELGRKCIAAVVGAMERCGCTIEAMTGAMRAYDESNSGELQAGDFRSAMQQCGVGMELSKG
eukprot:CAMPEP_0118645300 /NCGR_PEP_ID=MMETSP0785-20121206/7424_1 /TAXON_ID=91992 /ORGANISM="Bolidomonas pacifica, Strain CCMP 1866" /LENGTH=624 /DNA_ID=CAMNT_0006537167 /DNA_START=88 /DNA_END=1959 /DNA_ORIENTATION=+